MFKVRCREKKNLAKNGIIEGLSLESRFKGIA